VTDRMLVIPRKKKRRMRSPTENMKTAYGLEVVENHITYPLPKDRLFSNLPQAVRVELAAISSSAAYRKGEILFAEGQAPRGVFVIYEGRVKLSANSFDGKSLILHMAAPGEVVGLPGTISGKRYETTAEALEPVQASFISRKPFRDFVRAHGEVGLRVAETLSDIYHATYREVRYLGLSGSAEGKLARFLLDLTADQDHDHGQARAGLTLTHEEIADVVGTSRETVTRLFAEFKRKRLVEVHGSRLLMVNKAGLRKLLA
jgi:CRP/FNR family transcriptional regulator, cyclic AMP receptor protein